MTTSIPMQPGTTMLTCQIPARLLLSLHVIPGHPMFVSVKETDWAAVTWRLARPIKSVGMVPVKTVAVEFADGAPGRSSGREDIIVVHTVYVVAPAIAETR
jgi:hypothetical protein